MKDPGRGNSTTNQTNMGGKKNGAHKRGEKPGWTVRPREWTRSKHSLAPIRKMAEFLLVQVTCRKLGGVELGKLKKRAEKARKTREERG